MLIRAVAFLNSVCTADPAYLNKHTSTYLHWKIFINLHTCSRRCTACAMWELPHRTVDIQTKSFQTIHTRDLSAWSHIVLSSTWNIYCTFLNSLILTVAKSSLTILVKSLTLMLLEANLDIIKWCKKPEKSLKPWHIGTHLRVLSESYLMNGNITGFRCFSKIVESLCFGWK